MIQYKPRNKREWSTWCAAQVGGAEGKLAAECLARYFQQYDFRYRFVAGSFSAASGKY